MNKPFNPYSEWLDLPPDLPSPNHYQLLRIAPGETDIPAIVAAADRAMVKVRGHRPGKRAAEWAKLLDELSQVKQCLTDPGLRAAYDQKLGLGQPAGAAVEPSESVPAIAAVNQSADFYPPGMAPPDAAAAQTTRGSSRRSPLDPVSTTGRGKSKRKSGRKLGSAGAEDPMAPVSTPETKRRQRREKDSAKAATTSPDASPPGGEVPGASVARDQISQRKATPAMLAQDTPSLVADVPASEPINAHVSPPRRKESSVLPIVLGVAAALAILTLVLLFLATQRGKLDESTAAPSTATQRPGSSQPGSGQRPTPTPLPGTTERDTLSRPSTHGISPSTTADPAPSTPNVPTPDNPEQDTQPPTGSDQASPDDSGSPTTPDTPPVNSENIDDPFMNDPEEGSAPDSASSPAITPPTAAELAELSKALVTTRAAVGDLEFRIARIQLGKATTIAKLPEHKSLVARLDRLTRLSEQFWTTVRRAMGELRGAEELSIGDSGLIVIVVEVKPDAITIRRNGRNETYLLPDMPPGLALAIADRSFDAASSETPLMKGACLGTMKNPKQMHIDEAKRYWELARTQGAEVDDLLKTLTDNYELK